MATHALVVGSHWLLGASVTVATPAWLGRPARSVQAWLLEWWQLGHLGAVLLVLALTPSSYGRSRRLVLARHIFRNTAPILLGFSIVSALVTVVMTRIVLVTAMTYGLSQYALQVVIRVLVLELIPLAGALFVALRCTIPDGAELATRSADSLTPKGLQTLLTDATPRVVAGVFAGITLVSLSGLLVLVVAYLTGFGLTLSGLAGYSRMFGQVFNPTVTLIYVLKTLLFCLTVSLIPMASALLDRQTMTASNLRTSAEMRGLVRMFSVVLLIEVVSLIGNYS